MHSNKTTILTAALLILTFLAAGCVSSDSVQTKTAAQANQIDVKETPPTVEAPVEVIAESVVEVPAAEIPWHLTKDGFEDATVGAYHTLFDIDVEGVKHMGNSNYPQDYELFHTETGALIGTHQELTGSQLNLERELRDLYVDLERDYGSPVKVTKETDYVNNRVILEYIGSKDTFIHESDNIKKGTGRLIEDYLVSVPN